MCKCDDKLFGYFSHEIDSIRDAYSYSARNTKLVHTPSRLLILDNHASTITISCTTYMFIVKHRKDRSLPRHYSYKYLQWPMVANAHPKFVTVTPRYTLATTGWFFFESQSTSIESNCDCISASFVRSDANKPFISGCSGPTGVTLVLSCTIMSKSRMS